MEIRQLTLTTSIDRSLPRACADAAWPHVGECGQRMRDGVTVKHHEDGGRVSATRKAM
jgi:hypothetical protein